MRPRSVDETLIEREDAGRSELERGVEHHRICQAEIGGRPKVGPAEWGAVVDVGLIVA